MVATVKTGVALIAFAVVLLGIAGYVMTQIDGFAAFLLMPGMILGAAGALAIVRASSRPTRTTSHP